MTQNVVEFPDRSAIEEEAAVWLIKLDNDDPPSAAELALLREWLERSPVHREELVGLASFWDKMNVLTELAVPLGSPKSGVKFGFFAGLRRTSPRYRRFSIAAVMVAGIAVAATLWLRPDPHVASNGLYATAIGQQLTITLAEGSVVVLNTNSQIKVDYDKQYRDIRLLQGEAHFTVARNSERPFRVYAGVGRVQAVGTAFSVYLKDHAVNVTVTEGSVILASLIRPSTNRLPLPLAPSGTEQLSGSKAIVDDDYMQTLGTIKAGQSATIQPVVDSDASTGSWLDTIETVAAREMEKRLSWRQGLLTFNGDPLEAVVDEISRYTTISIEIADPSVRAIKIGGQFPVGETDAMFDALEANFGLRVTRLSHDHVLLSAANE